MIETWKRFWFAGIDVRQFAILRICLGGITVCYLIALLPLAELHFSGTGWLGDTRETEFFNSGSWSMLFAVTSKTATQIFFLFAIVFACGFTVGYKTRVCGILVYISLVSIWNRNPLILDGDDAVLRVMIFYLLLSGSGNTWSVDAVLEDLPRCVEVWPLRLIQLQIALIYFVSGWVKFHSADWSNGAIISLVLVHPEYSRWNFAGVLEHTSIRQWFAYIAEFIRTWEIAFPVLLLHPSTRKATIAIGILFHLGLLVFMNLRGFSIIMLTLYLALLPNRYFTNKFSDQLAATFKKKKLCVLRERCGKNDA